MTTERMLARMIARLDDPKLTAEGRAEINERLAWLDEIAQTMRNGKFTDYTRGEIENREMLLDAIDSHHLVDRYGETATGIEDSVRWNVAHSLVKVLELMVGPAPDDMAKTPEDWAHYWSL